MSNQPLDDDPNQLSDQVEQDELYEVAPSWVLQEKYGLTAENRPIIKLDQGNIPPQFRFLSTLAEIWGVSDDIIRNDVIQKASIEELQQLVDIVIPVEASLDDWLGDPQASKPKPSDEYIAVSCLRLAAYEAEFRLIKLGLRSVADD